MALQTVCFVPNVSRLGRETAAVVDWVTEIGSRTTAVFVFAARAYPQATTSGLLLGSARGELAL